MITTRSRPRPNPTPTSRPQIRSESSPLAADPADVPTGRIVRLRVAFVRTPRICIPIVRLERSWILLAFLAMSGVARGQLLPWPSLGGSNDVRAVAADAFLPRTEAAVGEALARVELQLEKVRRKADVVRTTHATPAEIGATPDELAEQEQAIQQWIIALDQQGRYLRRALEVRRLSQEQAADREAWAGFPTAPTVVMAEQLTDILSAQRLQLRTATMLLPILEAELARFSARLNDARKQLRHAQDEMESPAIPEPRRQWKVRLAALKVDADEAAVEAAELGRRVAWESVESQRMQVEFNERKLASARSQTRITRADLEGILGQIRAKRVSLQAELNEAIVADTALRASRDAAAREAHRDSPAGATRLRDAAEVAQARVETSAQKVESVRAFLQLADHARTVWEERLWAAEPRGLNPLRSRLVHYRQWIDGLRQWKALIEQSLSATSEQVLRHALRAEDGRLTPAERETAEAVHAALQERAALGLRLVGALVFTEDLTARLCAELSDQIGKISWPARLAAFREKVGGVLERIWQVELYIAEDSVIVGGQKVSMPRSITVGKVVIAATIFMAGLLAARLAHRLARRLGARWLAGGAASGEATARGVAVAVALLSLLVAMASVRIPWTIFAFMGGALAIGVGFGAQTLINNFISGVILHCERSIRIGDIIEVDDQRGKIVRVGFRNSLVARGDGIEVLVPNSQFLEKKVVNWTLSDELVRYVVRVGVSHESPPAQVAELMAQAAAEHPRLVQQPAPVVLLEEFGDHGLIFSLQFWLRLGPGVDGGTVRSDLRHRIHHLLDVAGIGLAIPHWAKQGCPGPAAPRRGRFGRRPRRATSPRQVDLD